MTLFRFQPYHHLRERPVVPTRAHQTWQPPVDVSEETERYVVRMDVPGVDPQEIELTTEDNVLLLKGVRQDTAVSDDRSVYTRRELPRGEFERSFRLPKDADGERISARGKNGVLEIFIPKLEQSKSRTIKVDG